jgi:hypothetical protein
VEGHVLQPFIMSRSVKVHPLAIVLAVIAGTTIKGIPGALISVPLVAFINTAVKALQHGPGDAQETMKQQVDEEIDEQNLEADDKERVGRHATKQRLCLRGADSAVRACGTHIAP